MKNSANNPLDAFWQQFYANRPELELFNHHSFATAQATIEPDTHKCLAPLHTFALLRVHGQDATRFLQGQLSADVEALDIAQTTFAAHCDAKGRMHANFLLHKCSEQEYWLQLHYSSADQALQALAKYAVFSKVVLDDISDQYACFGIEPLAFANAIRANTALQQQLTLLEVPGQIASMWLRREHLDELLAALPTIHSHWLGSAEWHKTIIQRGLGFVEHANCGEFIPQMLNLDCLNGISFTKGCYTGQEIIARMKYRGKIKRRCWLFSAELSSFEIGKSVRTGSIAELADCVEPGAALVDEAGQIIGQVVNSVVNSMGSASGLAVVKIAAVESACYLRPGAAESADLSIPAALKPPPYAITNN